jgi:hypothetical protein
MEEHFKTLNNKKYQHLLAFKRESKLRLLLDSSVDTSVVSKRSDKTLRSSNAEPKVWKELCFNSLWIIWPKGLNKASELR